MKILATESLIIRFADYNSTKLIKRDSTKGITVGAGQFYPGKSSIFSSLRRLGPFTQFFGQVMEWLILLSGQGPQGEVLKLMKDDLFRVLLAVWDIFFKYLARLRNGLYYNCMKR